MATGLPAWADDTVNINNQPVTPGESAAQCYADASEHLRKGMWYERAATQLKEAIRQDSKNSDYHLALGCAYADRAASLGYAAGFAAMHAYEVAQYPKDLADWEKAQQDPKSNLHGSRRPLPPPTFTAYTKDDLQTFTLTDDQVIGQVTALAKEAQAEWKEGVALTTSAKARANAEYIEGWGIDLLSNFSDVGQGMVDPQNNIKDMIATIPAKDDAAKAFTAATEDDPTQAVYWQSLGDALGPPQTGEDSSADKSGIMPDNTPWEERSMAAYRHALILNPKNAALWWNISQFEVRNDAAKAVDDLNQEIAADPTNAYPIYILAASEMKQTHYTNNYLDNDKVDQKDFIATESIDKAMAAMITDQDRKVATEAISLVEQGNDAPFCQVPVYHPVVPSMLAVAFDYMYRLAFESPTALEQDSLAHDLSGYADVAALNSDLTGGIDIDRDIIAMGRRMIVDWSISEDWKSGHSPLSMLLGIVVVDAGYTNMIRIAQHYGPPGMADAVQGEYDAFETEQEQWRAAFRQNNGPEQYTYSNY